MSKSELDPARHRWRQRSLRRRRREQTLAMHRYQQQQEDPMSKKPVAMGEVARLEQKTRATIDLDEAARLRAVVEAMKEDKAGDAARLARMSEGEARQHQLRRSAAHALQIAAESRKQLAVYAAEYNDMLEALTMVTREDWLFGIAPEPANVSIPLANSLTTTLSLIRDLRASLEAALATDSVRVYDGEPCGGYQKQIQILIDDAAREPPSHEGLP